jgi:hypothetical protein
MLNSDCQKLQSEAAQLLATGLRSVKDTCTTAFESTEKVVICIIYNTITVGCDTGKIKSLQIKFLCNQHSTEIHRFILGYIETNV